MTGTPKRKHWERKGGPCPECGALNCRSVQTFRCWVRTYQRAMRDHDYTRSRDHTRILRTVGFTILVAPELARNEVVYAPAWAVAIVDALRREARANGKSFRTAPAARLLREDHRFGPPPPALLDRIDELRAFAVLRGWRNDRGTWYRK